MSAQIREVKSHTSAKPQHKAKPPVNEVAFALQEAVGALGKAAAEFSQGGAGEDQKDA